MLDRIGVRSPAATSVAERAPLVGLSLVITLLAWPIIAKPIATGLDQSWQIALHLAMWDRLRQGVDIVFTYGPLGFLSVPEPYLGASSLLALLATGAVYLGLVTALLVEARRILPLGLAALVVLMVARLFAGLPPFEAFQALVFVGCVEALSGRIRLRPEVIAATLGVAAAVAALGKINVGIFVAGMGLVTALTMDRRWWRALAAYMASATVATLGLWLVVGQRLSDLPDFARGAYEIVAGYSEAMGTDRDPALLWIYLAFVVSAGLVGWSARRLSAGWVRQRRLGLAALVALIVFAMWKTAFVREFPAYAFATFVVALVALGAPLGDRRLWIASLLVVGVAFVGAAKTTPGAYVNVASSARSLINETVTAVLPGRARGAQQRNRALLRTRYGLEPAIVAELSGRTVSIDPVEAGAAFAYPEMTWSPLPLFQSYSAYTPRLDELNAARLRSADAPERILRGIALNPDPPDWLTRQRGHPLQPGESIPVTIDGRFRWFEAPGAMLEMFCRYRQLASSAAWQVLGRSGQACGPAEPLATVKAEEGVAVQVPVETRPDRFVTVRVTGMEPSILDRVKTLLFKADEWYVTIGNVRYRLVAATAGDGLLLAVPSSADGTGAFAFGPPIASLSIQSGLARHGRRTLTYKFESVPLVGSQ